MFVKNISSSLRNYLKSIGVLVLEISKEYKEIDITKLRWKLFIDFLKEKKNEYNLIFLTDVRDTFFQKDIFQNYENISSFLGVAIEDGTLNETINKKWVIDFAGEEKYKTIQNEKIICFGTIWGTFDKILELSIFLWEKLKFNSNSTDQGIGNYLIYYEKIFENYLLKSDNNGPIMTIGLTDSRKIIIDSKNNILNFKGEIAAVIHQYDRKPNIVFNVNNKFLFSNNQRVKIFIHSYLTEENKYKTQNIITFFILFQIFTILLFVKIILSTSKANRDKKKIFIGIIQ